MRSALLILALAVGNAQAEDADSRCPGVAAWYQAHPERSEQASIARDAERTLEAPALREQLALRVERDQLARRAWIAHIKNPLKSQMVRDVDDDNRRWLEQLVRKDGFPTLAQVGESGVHDAWLLVHHADQDPGFQTAVLAVLEARLADGGIAPNDYANLADRVLLGQGSKQRYLSQFSPAQWASRAYARAGKDELIEVEQRRAALGLMPLADYACLKALASGRGRD